jgi:deazaflavin-dependent oxidoreductase (nitroreductase family)
MAKRYRVGMGTRLVNAFMRRMVERGKGPSYVYIVSVPGRKTGVIRSNPIDVMDVGGRRNLVAPYGETNWVRNARAAGEVTLSRGGRAERFRVVEVDPDEAAPILRKYLQDVRVARPYFDVTADASDEQIAAEAKRHPVFRLEPIPS